MSDNISKLLSPIIQSQFPSFYEEEGPMFIEFVRAYYQWLEQSNNVLDTSKSLLDLRDVDKTIDDFIIHFKNKYIPLIKFNTATDKQRIIKNSLDLYRSKGTERSVDLFFRLVYGVPAEVYFPSKDIFRLSANEWVRPIYLEVVNTPYNKDFVGKQITGLDSGTTAFCENYIRKKLNNKTIDILFISSLSGDFKTGEKIAYSGLSPHVAPLIIGSPTTLDIFTGSEGFNVGDLVTLDSDNGVGGKARVANTSNTTGQVDFTLIDGGWGYTTNSIVYISQKVFALANSYADTTNSSNQMFYLFESLVQPQAQIQYESANGTFAANDMIYVYDGANTGSARILSVTTTNSTAGNLFVIPVSGNMQINSIFLKTGNLIGANVVSLGYTDTTAYGKIIGNSSNLTINIVNSNVAHSNTVEIYQTNSSGFSIANATVFSWSFLGANGFVTTKNAKGVFKPGSYYAKYSNGLSIISNGSISNVGMTVGIANLSGGDFTALPGNFVYGAASNTYANLFTIGKGTLANFAISNTLSRSETIQLYPQIISSNNASNIPFNTLALNATAFGFPNNVTANVSSNTSSASVYLKDILYLANLTIGGITGFVSVNPGSDYDYSPFVYVYEPYTAPFNRQDYFITISNLTGGLFVPGEVVTETATGAEGIVRTSNGTTIYVKRTTFFTDFSIGGTVVGQDSGSTATMSYITPDVYGLSAGENAIIYANTSIANGVVTKLEIVDSGYGYINNELVDFTSLDKLRSGSAQVNLLKQGISEGYLNTRDSLLSSDKRLFDGDYYQEYSYDVKVSITLDKYSEIFKNTIHVAGTKFFNTLITQSIGNTQISVIEAGAPTIS